MAGDDHSAPLEAGNGCFVSALAGGMSYKGVLLIIAALQTAQDRSVTASAPLMGNAGKSEIRTL